MTKSFTAIALVAASLIGSSLSASAQTPAAAPGAGGAAIGSSVGAAEAPRTTREREITTGASTGVVATEQPGVAPPSPTGAPVPNAAVSKPAADQAAPAGR